MSKFGEKLQRIVQREERAMGFAALAAVRPKVPSLALLASLSPTDVAGITQAAEDGADAVVLSMPTKDRGPLAAALKAAGDLPCGLQVKEEDASELQQLEELGVDFLFFATTETSSAFMDVEKVGKMLQVDAAWSDGLVRAADMLPVEALLLRLEEGPTISIYQRMQCQRLASLARHPLLVVIPPDLAPDSLRGLADAGVLGVLVETSRNAAGRIATLRQAIDALPPRKRLRERIDAVLPPVGRALAQDEEEEEVEFP